MKRLLFLSLALALALATGAAAAEPARPIDRGGSVALRAIEIARYEGRRTLTGYCSSACTMWLGYEKACVRLPATFGFHAVRMAQPVPNGGWIVGQMQAVYESHLPPGLRRWYRRHAADSDEIVRLTGRQVIERGWARECPRSRS